MDFPVAIRIPSGENICWIYLPDSIITVQIMYRKFQNSLAFPYGTGIVFFFSSVNMKM
jgi:hypothetical protein